MPNNTLAPAPNSCHENVLRKQPIVYWPIVALAASLTLIVVGLTVVILGQPQSATYKGQEMVALANQVPPLQPEITDPEKAPTDQVPAPASPDPSVPPVIEDACPVTTDGPIAGTPQNYGTSVAFLSTPTEAARQAKRDEKLMLILHVAGNFEDSCIT